MPKKFNFQNIVNGIKSGKYTNVLAECYYISYLRESCGFPKQHDSFRWRPIAFRSWYRYELNPALLTFRIPECEYYGRKRSSMPSYTVSFKSYALLERTKVTNTGDK